MTTDMTLEELDKLEKYLKSHGYICVRVDDTTPGHMERHQVIVYYSEDDIAKDVRAWDAICHPGSYGYGSGLLEVMGSAVVRIDGDEVEGYLTAQDIIDRLEEYNAD